MPSLGKKPQPSTVRSPGFLTLVTIAHSFLYREEDTSGWLLTDRMSTWPGTPAERGWRYLRQALEQNDCSTTERKYAKVVFDTILSHDDKAVPPLWLTSLLEVYLGAYCFAIELIRPG